MASTGRNPYLNDYLGRRDTASDLATWLKPYLRIPLLSPANVFSDAVASCQENRLSMAAHNSIFNLTSIA